jgi:filamentous hemagglutinin family protein
MLYTTKTIVLAAVFSLLNINLVAAQITPDNTLGSENSTVRKGNINGLPSDVIEGGATRGANLFHSFQEFNVPENQGAYFNPDSSINNILTRVTGGNVSNIMGTLGVIGNANLFLLNPNGILFGPNAKLDVNGSFLGTTADSILFNNYQFSASEKNPPPDALLTINIPIGLQLNNNQSKITVNSNIGDFKVKPEHFLTLIGGDIELNGAVILSPDSNINFGGLLGAGEVSLTGFVPTFPNNITRGNVALSNGANVNVRNDSNGLGSITINGNNLDLKGGSRIRAGIGANLGNINTTAGAININATGDVTLDGGGIFNTVSDVTSQGNAGNINITANNINLKNGTFLSADTNGQGNAGNIILDIKDTAKFDYSSVYSQIQSTAESNGNPSEINIKTRNLEVLNGTDILTNTYGKGNAGNIIINATNSVKFDGISSDGYISLASSNVQKDAVGNAGKIEINTGNLTISNGAYLSTNTNGIGDSGLVKIKATNSVELSSNSNIYSAANSGAVGNSNGIEINTKTLNLSDNSWLRTWSFGNGNAGNITINSDTTSLNNYSFIASFSNSTSTIKSGNINITTDTLELKNGSQIDASNNGSGNAGNVVITATDQVTLTGKYTDNATINYSALFTQATTGDAGQIDVTASSITLSDEAGMNSNTNGSGTGGNINLTATNGDISLTNGAQIQAVTKGSGNAGNLSLTATTGKISLNDSNIFSTVEAGATADAGNIKINSQSLSLENSSQLQTLVRSDSDNILPPAKGNAGNITINVTDSITIQDPRSLINSSTLKGTQGQAGDISLTTKDLIVSNGGKLASSILGTGDAGTITLNVDSFNLSNGGTLISNTAGQGNAGDININATGDVAIDNSQISNKIESTGISDTPSNINITANNLQLTNGGLINSNTAGQGKAGDINITATNSISLDGQNNNNGKSRISSQVESTGVGNAGNIELNTNSLSLTNGGAIAADTKGKGDAGNIKIMADNITMDNRGLIENAVFQGIGKGGKIDINSNSLLINGFSSITSLATAGQGDAGDINVNSNLIKLNNGGQINASVGGLTDNADNIIKYGVGNAGNITINSQDLILEGVENGYPSSIGVFSNAGAQGKSGDIAINTNNLRISDAGQINNAVGKDAKGDGGNINIIVHDSFKIDGFSDITGTTSIINSLTEGEGNAGNININANYLELTNGGLIAASTDDTATGKGGNIDITANNLTINNAFGINSSTNGNFDAGNINIKVVDNLTISGKFRNNTDETNGIISRGYEGSTGNSGSIFIDPNTVTIKDGARIAVDNKGTGTGGNITLIANTLNLDNGVISAATNSADGGSIDLNIANNLNLRNASEITATAGKSQGAGNGGNINLNADFIINYPRDNKITANAYEGNGGNIIITSNGILGPQYLDITASSELGLQGNIEMNIPKTDPASGLIQTEKPSIDIAALFAKDFCKLAVNSSFVYIGRGGKVVTPDDNNDVETGLINWVDNPYSSNNNIRGDRPITSPTTEKTPEIRQAQGWVKLPDGTIILTAHPVEVTPMGVKLLLPNCN